jgi:hypothetical protein
MAVRAVNSCSFFRSASSPPLSAVRCRLYHCRTLHFRRCSKLGFRFQIFRSEQKLFGHGGVRSCSVHSLVDSVMEELDFMRKRKRVSAATKIGLTSSGELLENKLANRALEKGLLLEFKKDSDRVLLAVAQRPDGKKNWMVFDQVLVETTKCGMLNRMVLHPPLNLNKLLILFRGLRILIKRRFQILFGKHRITWIQHFWSLLGLNFLKKISQ